MKSLSKNITIIVAATVIATLCACANAKAKDTDKNNVTISAQSNETVPIRTLPKGAVAFDYTYHLYFDVVLRDSIPARMVFDTGNTSILLDEAFHKKHFAHLGNLRKAMAAGAGNAMQAVNLDMNGWKYSVGEHNQTEQEAVVMDLRKILGDGVDGMFGMAFMRGRKVEFNYTDEYMRILPQEEQPSAEYTCIKCKWLDASQTRMLIPIKVKITDEVSFDGNFLVDMGASTGMLLNSNLATKLNLKSVLPNTKKIIYDVAGVGGSATNYIFRAK
ncbi:MAG: aspartyl protease family protein, partial [Alistipes sp.]|nr:aspartyl protease family protein [Alistipes sp.]